MSAATLLLLAACALSPPAPTASNLTLEMRRLQATLEKQEQTVQNLSQQVSELDNRLQRQAEKIEQFTQTPQQAQSGYQSPGTPQSQGAAATAIQGEGSPTEIYLQAFGDYASGRYQTAVRGFATFLQRFPNNGYASNAQFWLGDCYFNQQQYPVSIQEFQRVLNNYPSAAKSPDALLKIAIAHLQLGATAEARQAIETLQQRYPKSAAALKAQELTIP